MSINKLTKRELFKYLGDMSQICGVKDYTLRSGRAEGMRAVDVKNGAGLDFTVIPDRALDVSALSFKGLNISYMSISGLCSPQYFDDHGNGFGNTWCGGFLTTCGLTTAGNPSVDNGVELPLHGLADNTPAEDVYAGMDWEGDIPVMRVKGKIRQAKHGAENLVLKREIICRYGENKIYINDSIENNGFKEEPLMLIYHCNIGYPLLDEGSYFVAPSLKVEGRSEKSIKNINNHTQFDKPTANYEFEYFYHWLKGDCEGKTGAAIINPALKLGVAVKYNLNQLKLLTQVKNMIESTYMATIEPLNCGVEGRAEERRQGRLEFIKPGEIRNFNVEIEILDGDEEIGKFLNSVTDLRDKT